ncbi:sigma-54-dependent Fis family transcriptional regulator [candidate division KSB1 bacterium]|nr:sigma-54-dependent Fis family transcriptional regulator [candidate division KSB1 bacterium]
MKVDYRILVVDDEAAQRETLTGFLQKKGYHIQDAASGREAIEAVTSGQIDLVLTDLRMPDMDGAAVLKGVKEINPEIDVIIMTAYGSVESATEAMKSGAVDFIGKPIDLEQLHWVVAKTLERKQLVSENRRLRELVAEKLSFGGIISASPAMDEVLSVALRAAASRATVLIVGESGTGKELVAKAIHYAGDRGDKPFVAINMAALSDNLVESELFGHEKGAFTGADKFRKGRFELADGGTLFIDEVGEIPLSTQVKLLRVLQEQEFERVGGSQPIKLDVRLITATNRSLEDAVREGTFRQDLYYRLNVVKVELPPLRRRREDIPLLTDHFVRRFSLMTGKSITGVSKEAMDLLMKYSFPGNVRELENIIERAVVLSRDTLLSTADLPVLLRGERSDTSCTDISAGGFEEQVARFETDLLLQAMKSAGGVQTRAAELLHMSERHLRYKLKKYGIQANRFKA